MKDKELDKLLCLIDGKITVYRNHAKELGVDDKSITIIQKKIIDLWEINRRN